MCFSVMCIYYFPPFGADCNTLVSSLSPPLISCNMAVSPCTLSSAGFSKYEAANEPVKPSSYRLVQRLRIVI